MTTDQYPLKTETTFDHEAEDRFFVSLFDPTGTMLTARKMREHLSLAEAKALQADVTEQGGLLLIYKEKTAATPARLHDPSQAHGPR